MFLCEKCIKADKVKINNKSYALLILECGRGSYGLCECCHKLGGCVNA